MAPPFVSVKNLEKYQHYKHRNPPWIKFYYSLLNDPVFLSLNEVQQCRYMKLLLIASQQMNCISTDPEYLGKMLRISEQVDLTPLINAGFLIAHRKRQSNKMLAPPHGNRAQSRVEKSRVETEKSREEPPLSPGVGLSTVVLPDWLPFESWANYLDMRKTIKRPLTANGQKLAIQKLTKLKDSGCDPIAVLDQSTFNSWQGLFAPKEDHANGTHKQKSHERPRNPSKSQPGKYAHLGTVFDQRGED